MSFSQLLSILTARKSLAIWIFTIIVLATIVISLLLPKTYTATATLIINTKGADPISGYSLQAMMMPGYMATQVDILESRNVALKVVRNLNLESNPNAKEKFEKATDGKGDINLWYADLFGENLEVEPSKESSVIDVSYRAADPDFAATMANAYATAYIDTSLQLKTDPAKQASAFFDNQLKSLRENVEKSQAKLSAYQKEHGITSTEGRLDVEMARLSDLSSQLVVAQAQTYDSNSRNSQLNRGSASESPEILSNGLIQGLKSQLVQAEARLTDVSQRLGFNHPQYQSALQDVENIRASIQKEIAKTSSGVGQMARVSQQKEAEIKASLAAQKERVLKLKSEQDEMAVLVRELDSAQRIYDNALLRFGQTSMESQSGQTDIAVLNSATPPLKSSSPKIILNIMVSIFLGAILATVAAMFAEVIDRRVRCAEDLSTNLNVPLLADLTNKKTFSFSDWLKSKSLLKQNKNKKTLISKYQFSTK
jgi:polysaccharide biosynthesis transport protein